MPHRTITAWIRVAGPWTSAASLAGAGLLAALLATPVDTARVAAVFPPWWSPARSFAAAAAAGDVAGTGALHSILIVGSDRPDSDRPDLAERLYAAGALLLLAADGPFGCRSILSKKIVR